jgi:transcriptional regulator with GAF, ATPase, and Fis domain
VIDTVAALTSTILIQVKPVPGKELIAKAIHFNSPRKEQKMISINCGAIPGIYRIEYLVTSRERSPARRHDARQ